MTELTKTVVRPGFAWMNSPGSTDSQNTETQSADAAEEALLLARIADGERAEPMEELCRRYTRRIYALGIQMLGDKGMAEELVQDTFVRVWKSADRFDPTIASARTFIYTLARRAAIDLRRRPSANPLATGDSPAGTISDPEADRHFDRLVLGIDVREAIETLSPKHRDTIRLSYDDDLTQGQIAERLDIPIGTVKTRIHHALKALKLQLEERDLVA